MAKGDQKSERTDSSNSKSYGIMHPVDLNKIVLPMQDNMENILPLCPVEFNDAI